MVLYRRKPTLLEAIQWLGGDTAILDEFCGQHWDKAEYQGIYWTANRLDEAQIVLWNTMESQWIQCPVGHYVIRGIMGELYPCDPVVFEKINEPVTEIETKEIKKDTYTVSKGELHAGIRQQEKQGQSRVQGQEQEKKRVGEKGQSHTAEK